MKRILHSEAKRRTLVALRICGALLFGLPMLHCQTEQAKFLDSPSIQVDYQKTYATYCRLEEGGWRRVVGQDAEGVTVEATELTFSVLWEQESEAARATAEDTSFVPWERLGVPLPDVDLPCLGYALTYPSHRAEVRLEDSFYFEKGGPAFPLGDPIAYRPNLDYEAEVGILVRRDDPHRFGYVMVNDLTDRGVQVQLYEKDNPGPGFSVAKSFPNALRIGPLLAIGGEALWEQISVELRVNGTLRQQVQAAECLLTPHDFQTQAIAAHPDEAWVLVSSGTSEGVVFKTPSAFKKLVLFLKGGFSVKGAGEALLEEMVFLQVGDEIEMESNLLGRMVTNVAAP